jgi:DNA-binding transcriptional ArsR family regulator
MEMAGSKRKRLYGARARVMKALAQPIRMEIADVLAEGEMCVDDLAAKVGAERSNVSRHLSVLAGTGIVDGRREGLKVFYSLKVP